jgi:hypothetical protein
MTGRWIPLLVGLLATVARAEVQRSGPEEWPGRFQLGVHVPGGQVGFQAADPSGYQLGLDFAVRVAERSWASIWIGAAFDAGVAFSACAACGHDVQGGAFAQLTFERRLNLPIVPYARAGLGGGALLYAANAGVFALRLGGGVDYWILRRLAVGVETALAFGAAFFPAQAFGPSGNQFYGVWDLALHARVGF